MTDNQDCLANQENLSPIEATQNESEGKRHRSPNKNQFKVWTMALPVFIANYTCYIERQEIKKFYGLLATECGYGSAQAARNATNRNIQKWVDEYVDKTGPNNTGGANVDLQAITKQNKVSHAELESLIQSYIPFLGCKRRHNKFNKTNNGSTAPVVINAAKDAIIDLTNEKKRAISLLEDSNYLVAKKQKNDNESRLSLLEQMALAYREHKQCVSDGNEEMALFWKSECARIHLQLKKDI